MPQLGRDYRYANPPIRVRPASAAEGTPYLAEPVFSSCTVPVVWYPMWLANLAHFYRGKPAAPSCCFLQMVLLAVSCIARWVTVV